MKFLLVLALLSNAAFASAKYVPGSYDVDVSHSKVGFEIAHMMISTVEGRFSKFSGKVELAEKFTDSKFSSNVDINSINTEEPKRDEHLKSPDFFDAAKFADMKFESSSVTGTPEAFKIKGKLTIKGVSKDVTFAGKYTGAIVDPYGNQKVGFSAKTKISRKDFGLTWNKLIENSPAVGDEVTIDLKIEAGHPIAKK